MGLDRRYASEHRDLLVEALQSGQIPLLVTSPESLTKNSRLSNALRDAVSTGTFGALVIDEAHLYTQWGRIFAHNTGRWAGCEKIF